MNEEIFCAACDDLIEGNYLEANDPDHGEPVQFCGSICAGNYLIPKMCKSKTVVPE